jgi:nucleoside-diphosphate-sugar epimerase
MNKEKILLVGASGFAGHHVLQELSSKNVEVTTLSRKSLPDLPLNTKNYIFNFTDIDSYNEIPLADHLVVCLGSPLKLWDLVYLKKSDIPKFIALDKDCVINLAKAAKKIGIKKISIVSAVGANSQSFNTYLKTKGRVEEEIIAMNFESTNIFRPAHMCGRINWEKSKNTYRFDVFIGEYISILTKPFMIGSLNDFKGVDVKILAKSIAKNILIKNTGVQYFTYRNFNN